MYFQNMYIYTYIYTHVFYVYMCTYHIFECEQRSNDTNQDDCPSLTWTELGKSCNKCVDVDLALASGGLHAYVLSASAISKPAGRLSCRAISSMRHTYLSLISLSVSLSLYIYSYIHIIMYTHAYAIFRIHHVCLICIYIYICVYTIIFVSMYMYM